MIIDKPAKVSQEYAEANGLQCQPSVRAPCPPSLSAKGHWTAEHVIVGPIAGGRSGMLGVWFKGPPIAQFGLPGVSKAIDGLCVHRSGTNLLTRQPLPKRYHELKLSDEAFSEHFRVGIANFESEEVVRRVLDPEFTKWFADHFGPGSSILQAGTFDFIGGILFLRGDPHCYDSLESFTAWAADAVGLADRVATWTENAGA